MTFRSAFEPDEVYDRNYASNGVSRYSAYLAQHSAWFVDEGGPTTDAGRFAAAAWRVARPPTMAPAYVRHHGRVQNTCVRWDDDQRQAICVDLAVSSSPEAVGLVFPWRRWTRDGSGYWYPPDDYVHPNAVTVLQIAVPVAGVRLPTPRYRHGAPDTATAKRAVGAICAKLNEALSCVFKFDPLDGRTR